MDMAAAAPGNARRSDGRLCAAALGLLLGSLPAIAQTQPSPEERMQRYRVTPLDVARVEEGIRNAEPTLSKLWARTFANRRLAYKDPRIVSVSAKGASSGCGPVPFDLNNAFYCRLDHTIYYDPIFLAALRRVVAEKTGRPADQVPIVTLAHEWGHAVQSNLANLEGISRLVEQDADCYAGVGLREISQASDPEGELAVMESFYRLASDRLNHDGSQWSLALHFADPGAHGNLFDRLIAFKDGYRKGVDACQAQDRWRGLLDRVAPN